jgi:molecular chaperone GrpE
MSQNDAELKVVDRRWWVQQGESEQQAGFDETGDPWRPGKPTYVEELERQLADKDRHLQETLVKYREAAHEFDAARARLRKEIAKDVERGRRVMLTELLDVLDNLDRAVEAATRAQAHEAVVTGVDIVRRSFLAKLEGFGVSRIDVLGERFDPTRHEAITVVPTDNPGQDGMVCGVLAPGYAMTDSVLRPARVAVARFGSGAATTG